MSTNADLQWAWFDAGVKRERERILKLVRGAPVALEFYQPYIGTEELIAKIEEENHGV